MLALKHVLKRCRTSSILILGGKTHHAFCENTPCRESITQEHTASHNQVDGRITPVLKNRMPGINPASRRLF